MLFKSCEEGDQSSSLQKFGSLYSHLFLVLFDLCDGAPSCWDVNRLSMKCILAFWSAGVEMNSMYKALLTFAPWGTTMRGHLNVFDLVVQVMSEEGFWRIKIRLSWSGMSLVDVASLRSFCGYKSPQQWTVSRQKKLP